MTPTPDRLQPTDAPASRPRADSAYRILHPLPWDRLIRPLAEAEDALARLDERLSKSPVGEGWRSRSHFHEACASLWLDGELVHLEDLVLHDARMDIRTPTAELVQGHAALRARRRIASAQPGWSLSLAGLDLLRGRQSASVEKPTQDRIATDEDWDDEGGDEWARTLDAVDAVLARSTKLLAGEQVAPRARPERPTEIYDLDWDEDARITDWLRVVDDVRTLPPTLGSAITLDAWTQIEPLQTQPWLGRLLTADLLRRSNKTRSFMVCMSAGLKRVPQQRRWRRDPTDRLLTFLEAMTEAASLGLKDLDSLSLAKQRLDRKASGRRANSRLPALVDLMIETPIASADLIAQRLKATPRAALMMASELGLRESTGRSRYRAWSAT